MSSSDLTLDDFRFNTNLMKSFSDNTLEKSSKEEKISKVMKEFKEGNLKSSSGNVVTDKNQAIAIALSEAGVEKAEDVSDACWEGYEAYGTKKKNGKEVPNCVPKKKQ